MARLILATAEGQQAIELRPINSLGRHPNNSIQLLDKIVSKEHCILEQRDGGFVLRDLGSLNGTYINGERVRGEAPLRHGDEIALGSTRARFDDGAAARRSTSTLPAVRARRPRPAAGSAAARSRIRTHRAARRGMQQPGAVGAPGSRSRAAAAAGEQRIGMPAAERRTSPRMQPAGTQAQPGRRYAPRPALAGARGRSNARRLSAADSHGGTPPAAAARSAAAAAPRAGSARRASAARASTCSTRRARSARRSPPQTKGFLPFDQIAARPAAAPRRLRAPPPLVGALARDRPRARHRQLLEKILMSRLQVRARRPRRHLPPRGRRRAHAARRAAPRRHRRADPGLARRS